MRIWPFGKVERRAADYTALVLAQLQDNASGSAIDAAVAAMEVAVGLWGRAMATAKVTPETPATAALTPSVLLQIGRSLMLPGEIVMEIVMDDGELVLLPASSWNIAGGPARSSWVYECTLSGPSGTETRTLAGNRVVHVQYAKSTARPWEGCGPLSQSSTTAQLAKSLELRLTQEVGMKVGAVLPMPQGAISGLQADIDALKGKSILVPSTAGNWDQGADGAPRAEWTPRRLGANPPPALVDLRTSVAEHVLAACGVPPALLGRSDGTLARESWRQFLHGAVRPISEVIAEELADKLEEPGLSFSFDALQASDVQGRARAFGSLVQAGMDPAQAEIVAGLREV